MLRQYLSNMNIRIIIREEMGDSLDWIQDTMSNQDIAQEIADETEIKNNKLYLPSSPPLPSALSYPLRFPFSLFPPLFLFLSSYRLPPAFFTKYCKEQYGLDKEESKDIWVRYKKLIKDNLNESDDLKWVRDVEANFDDMNLRVGDMFRVPTVNEDGSTFSIVTIIDTGLRGNKPITYKIESGMGQLQQRNVVDNKVGFIQRIIKDKWRPLYGNRGYKLNESDELDWIRDTNPLSYEYVNNKGLEFNPPITDDDYWDKVKSSLEAIGCVVDFDIDDWYDSGVGMLGLFVEDGEVIWTTADIRQGTYQEHIDSYADKPVEVIDGRSLFPL